jgi:tetratricopeptide (TPR) repeat protein
MAGKVGRARRTLGQLWQVPTFALGLAAFLLVAATAPLRQDTAVREFDNDLDQLCQAVSNKQENIQANVSLAESLLQRLNPKSRKAGQVYFLAGSVYQRLAEQSADGQVDEIRKKAIAHLDKARSLGLADEDTPVLLYRLGVLLYESGTNLEQARDLIASSVNKGSDDPARGYALLAQGYLRLPRPDLEAALTANQKQLQLSETDAEILEARLFGGDLLVLLGRTREALGILEPIGPKAPKAPRIRARLLQTQCCQQDNQWQEAVRYWKALLPDAAEVPGGRPTFSTISLCAITNPNQRIWPRLRPSGGKP